MRFQSEIWLWGTSLSLLFGALYFWGRWRAQAALFRFFSSADHPALLSDRGAFRRTLGAVLLGASVFFAFIAAARPEYGRGTRIIPRTNLDVVLVLDYSKSMYARDVAPSRLDRAKVEATRLIQKLAGARVGAVAFAGEPLAFPLTSDGAAIAQFLKGLDPNDMPVGGTAIARALSAGKDLFAGDPLSARHEKVLVLVTDGEDLEGDPVGVAGELKAAGIPVFVVQIGGQSPEPIPNIAEDGAMRGYRKDARGGLMLTSLSEEGEKQLEGIATASGGRYRKAGTGQVGIDEVANELRAKMNSELSEKVETVFAAVYHYPLMLSVLLLLLEAFLSPGRRIVPPSDPPRKDHEQRTKKRNRAAGAAVALLCISCGQGRGDDPLDPRPRNALDRLFVRNHPDVEAAISDLGRGEPSDATKRLVDLLQTGACENSVIGAGERAKNYGDASFDLGLSFGRMWDAQQKPKDPQAFGLKLDPSQGAPGLAPPDKADASLIDCAGRLLSPVASDPRNSAELRASAHYLLGNFEMRREAFEAALSAYDLGLMLAPGTTAPKPDAPETEIAKLGRMLAKNRAIALRRWEEKRKQEEEEKKNQDEQQKDSEEKKDQDQDQSQDSAEQNDSPGEDQEKPQEKDPSEKNPSESEAEQKKDQAKDSAESQAKNEPGKDSSPDPKEGSSEPNAQEPGEDEASAAASNAQKGPAASQEDRILDIFEAAETLQGYDAKRRKGRVIGRGSLEDK